LLAARDSVTEFGKEHGMQLARPNTKFADAAQTGMGNKEADLLLDLGTLPFAGGREETRRKDILNEYARISRKTIFAFKGIDSTKLLEQVEVQAKAMGARTHYQPVENTYRIITPNGAINLSHSHPYTHCLVVHWPKTPRGKKA
jgi:hypothetical protein